MWNSRLTSRAGREKENRLHLSQMMRKSATILIVDDDSEIRDVMKLFLEADGYRVIVANDGSDALDLLMRDGSEPALIFLDLVMPRMDGEQFLLQLRKSRPAKTPVVILSGHGVAKKKADELGAVCCLMKPVEIDDLLKTVRRFAPIPSTKDAV
jgi:DNA-binding response OmpR family regulator